VQRIDAKSGHGIRRYKELFEDGAEARLICFSGQRTEMERTMAELLCGRFEVGERAVAVRWGKRPGEVGLVTHPGVYSLRTNETDRDPERLWWTYTRLTDIEAMFRSLKSELGDRAEYPGRAAAGDRQLPAQGRALPACAQSHAGGGAATGNLQGAGHRRSAGRGEEDGHVANCSAYKVNFPLSGD